MLRTPMLLLVAAALAACGGTSTSPSTVPGPGAAEGAAAPGDDPATPFDDRAVKDALAADPNTAACGLEVATFGDHMTDQVRILGGADGVNETFTCQPADGGRWECLWSVFAKPSPPSPDDPCAEFGGTPGYIVIVQVGSDGAFTAGDLTCNAPG